MKMTAETKSNLSRLVLMLGVYLIFAVQIPSYYSTAGFAALLDSAVLAGIIAIGVGLTMIAGEMDLSVGSMAAFAGILATTRVGSVQPGQGAGLELQAIAACVIGGLSLRGGRGSILGVFLGVMLIFTITDVLLLMRAPGFYLDMFIATLIVAASIFNHGLNRGGASS